MITSRDVHNRILWDARLDASAFVIGYADRHATGGIVETPAAAWDPHGDVPWHRVRYFRCGDQIVWDRELQIDLFTSDALPEEAWAVAAPGRAAPRPWPRLSAEMRAALLGATPTHRSAAVVIPPETLWPAIQEIRRQHDRNAVRWMPHVTLVYPFLPEDLFADAAPIVASILAGFAPFTVRLEGFDTFRHRSVCTAWLRPVADPSDAFPMLHRAVESLFPSCAERGERELVPHLSVGQFRNPEEAFERLPEWRSVSFEVSSIAFISRRGEGPFEVREEVSLGG